MLFKSEEKWQTHIKELYSDTICLSRRKRGPLIWQTSLLTERILAYNYCCSFLHDNTYPSISSENLLLIKKSTNSMTSTFTPKSNWISSTICLHVNMCPKMLGYYILSYIIGFSHFIQKIMDHLEDNCMLTIYKIIYKINIYIYTYINKIEV